MSGMNSFPESPSAKGRNAPVTENPLIVQNDRTLLLEVDHPKFEEARDVLLRFAELVKSPEYVHTYRLTPISLWNAASSGMTFEQIMDALSSLSKYPVPENIPVQIGEWLHRYGRLVLNRENGRLVLRSDEPALFAEIVRQRNVKKYLAEVGKDGCSLLEWSRGQVKKECIDLGYPVVDRAGFTPGDPFPVRVRPTLQLRPYQDEAVSVFLNFEKTGGSGIITLPCGSGKTIVGISVLARLETRALILVTSITAARQWKRELLTWTDIREEDIGEYSGECKEIRPVTIATYQIMAYRPRRRSGNGGGEKSSAHSSSYGYGHGTARFVHLDRLGRQNWGLVLYDEVHLLPAPIFRFSSEVQSRRRLGLTATLIREDGREGDVFSLIGPKIYDVPWRVLERQGWIADASCTEIRVDLEENRRYTYAMQNRRSRFKTASVNPAKYEIVDTLLDIHRGESILVIGQYIDQLEHIAERFALPIITGKTPNREREDLYGRFRRGEIKTLVVSKVANFAVDLPDAAVLIQVSGIFGSRQEEAQRLGRIIRPKEGGKAYFYTVVTRNTVEIEFAEKRQLFLIEQGYSYEIEDGGRLKSAHASSGSE